MTTQTYVGTAGWAVPRDHAAAFAREGSGLARYASALHATEINTTFYKRHRASTFARWRETVGPDFRFAVKVPQAITHEGELARARPGLKELLEDVAPLGETLGPLLVQLPASLAFDGRRASSFFRTLRALHGGPVACEPRHASWFTGRVDALLRDADVARVVADPPRPGGAAAEPGGAATLVYMRLHGSPRTYYSEYGDDRIASLAQAIRNATARGARVWCIFDNTASGAAAGDALRMARALDRDGQP